MSLISQNGVTVAPQNTQTQFIESFKTYDTANTWTQTVATGDIVQLDGNAAAASYLVISKDPLTAGSETSIVTQAAFTGPFETSVGLGISQRVLGQETAIELISTDTPLAAVGDMAISSIGSNSTTVYITTANPHGLSVGQRIGVYGVTSDSRMNYPSLVVSAIVSPTQVYATAGPGGTVTTLTVGPYASQGYLYVRPALGYAVEGVSEIFENSSVTNASYYVRADSGDVYASGTIGGNHSVTCGSTGSAALAAASYTYAYAPTNEFKFLLQADRVNFFDAAVDTTNQPSARINRTTVVPSIAKTYKLRIRATNNKGLTVPTAKIVSAAKAGTTTATITTAAPHGLTAGDFVYITGIRNGTDFVPLTTSVQVAASPAPTSTTFTVAYGGTSATVTSYGGFVARAQGTNLPAGFAGAGSGAAIQSAAVTATELTLVSSSATPGVSIGDYVNVYGCRDAVAGGDMGVDGVYKVANIVTTTSTLTLIPIGGTTLPTAFATTNCGGAIIRRSDIRISYARINQYLRERVEILNKSDAFSGIPVTPNGGNISTITTASLAINNIVADASGTIAAGTNVTVTAITPASSTLSQEFNIIVTGTAGVTPTLDYVVQESDDTGTNWYDTYHFPRITAVGQYRSPLIPFTGNRVRYIYTLAGTSTPTFTRVVNRIQSHSPAPLQRQFFDRALVINTINSVTAGTFFVDGCRALAVMVSMGAVTTTAPVLVLEISPDNATWVQAGADITTAANANNLLTVTDALGRFARIRVKTAGSGATLNFIMIKGSA